MLDRVRIDHPIDERADRSVPAGRTQHLQPKLVVGAVDDPAEREADRVADAVLRSIHENPRPTTIGRRTG